MAEAIDQDILAAVNAEVADKTPEQIKEELLKYRVRQKVQQAKNQNKGSQKAYQQKKRAEYNAMKAKAIELGIWGDIEADAKAQADAKLAEDAGDEVQDEDEVTA